MSPLLPTGLSAFTLSLLVAAAPAGPATQESETPGPAASEIPRISALSVPLYLEDLPPEVRSVRLIHLVHTEVENAARDVTRTPEEAVQLGEFIVNSTRAGEDWEFLSREYSSANNAATGGHLGSVPPGLLAPAMDTFLFQAEVGEVSEPLVMENGVHILQRVETYAATRHILIAGKSAESKAKAEELLQRIEAGEDFGALAKEHSDGTTAPLGGLYTIFERGAHDRLLKKAAFEAKIGETKGPIESPGGYHLLQRVTMEGHPRQYAETSMIRARGILISHDNTPLGTITANRPMGEAERLATEIRDRVRSGEDMVELAKKYNDDIGGKLRAGDLGWLHRNNPRSAPLLRQLFQVAPGEVVGPVLTNVGYVVVRREH